MDPHDIAGRLIDLAARAEAELTEIEVNQPSVLEIECQLHIQEFDIHQRYCEPAKEMLAELQAALTGADWEPEAPSTLNSEQGHWKFGTAMTVRTSPRPIHRGFLQPLTRVSILANVPDHVAMYLITITDGEEYLKRERHDVIGWHYHYLNDHKIRSDVVLCWDTRWNAPDPQTKSSARRGLFVEKHAEKGKRFIAKPHLWGSQKRNTMYDACLADLKKRKITEYRCAANKSELVYPPGASLTPHSAAFATALKAAVTKNRKSRKKRR